MISSEYFRSFSCQLRFRIGVPVISALIPHLYKSRSGSETTTVIPFPPVGVLVYVRIAVVAIIKIVPVIMIAVIVMPEKWFPWPPVRRIIAPIPG